MKTVNRTPTALDDAIEAEARVVNNLAAQYDKAVRETHDLGVKLAAAHDRLTALRLQQVGL